MNRKLVGKLEFIKNLQILSEIFELHQKFPKLIRNLPFSMIFNGNPRTSTNISN